MRNKERGSIQKNMQALRLHTTRLKARQELRDDMYAKSSVGRRKCKLATLQKMANMADPHISLRPLTPDGIEALGAAFKMAGYRTGDKYLQTGKEEHIKAGFQWSPQHARVLRNSSRSILRGIGDSKRAPTFGLENLAAMERTVAQLEPGGPVSPQDSGIVMSMWMLRGLEAASVLGEQATIDLSLGYAAIYLAASKTNPQGRGCVRTLACACKDLKDNEASAPCPVHAL